MQSFSRALAAFVCALISAPLVPAADVAQQAFPKQQMMTVGVYYYPEAWPQSQWERDIQNIHKLGMEFIHMGEFAWYFMEPEEGKFDFDWLEKNVELASRNHLKVILCTPSAAPPIWLSTKHPEILMVDAQGRTMLHGSREHGDWSSPVFRDYVKKIDTELVRRFGHDPRVWGWQIDNELSHYGRDFSYSPAAQQAFRDWLKQRYKTIDKLNESWGGGFWSTVDQNFDQVQIPNPEQLIEGPSPSAVLDFRRFFAWSAADYLKMQADVIRQYSSNQWITTNFQTMHEDVDPSESQGTLDVFTWTHYPVHGQAVPGPLGFRLGDAGVMNFMHDFMRPFTGYFGLMELQPGEVNWGNVNPWPLPGAIHMWIMQAFGQGAQIVCTYRYRQPLYGREMYHKGLAETDGVTPSPGGREYAEAMRDMQELRKHYDPNAQEPKELVARRTAFLIAYDNRWDITEHKQTDRWDTVSHWLKYYRALKSMEAPVDVLTPDRDFSKYPFVVAPAFQLVDKKLVRRWTEYVENGGHLVLTCRTAQKNMEGHLWEALWAEPIYHLIGARIPFYDDLPDGVDGSVEAPTGSYKWGSWADIIDPDTDTAVLAKYADQFYKGRAAAVVHKVGKGSVLYVGVDTLDGKLEHDLLQGFYAEAGAAPMQLPENFVVDWRDGFWVATNFTSEVQHASIPVGAQIFVGQRDVPPGGVTIWR